MISKTGESRNLWSHDAREKPAKRMRRIVVFFVYFIKKVVVIARGPMS